MVLSAFSDGGEVGRQSNLMTSDERATGETFWKMRGPGLKDVNPPCQPLAQRSEITLRTSARMDSGCTGAHRGSSEPDLRDFTSAKDRTQKEMGFERE
jgi:hypothetical protein